MKVLMAEDLTSVREHLSGLLVEARAVEVRFVGQDTAPLMQAAAEWQPEVVILDVRMRGTMTLGILESIKKERPDTAVAVSAFFFEPYYREAYLRHGADFFFDKSLEWQELITFLRRCEARFLSQSANAPLSRPADDGPQREYTA